MFGVYRMGLSEDISCPVLETGFLVSQVDCPYSNL